MHKIAIVILSDPRNKDGADEALGRIFNALILANDIKNRKGECKIFFQGTGTRWVEELEKSQHPAHGLYKAVKSCICGVSNACSMVFKANVEDSGVKKLAEFEIPGLGWATSLGKVVQEGYNIITF